MGRVLVLDVGTSSLKAAVFDKHFVPVAKERVEYAYEAEGLKMQIDVEKVWNALAAVTRRFQEGGALGV